MRHTAGAARALISSFVLKLIHNIKTLLTPLFGIVVVILFSSLYDARRKQVYAKEGEFLFTSSEGITLRSR